MKAPLIKKGDLIVDETNTTAVAEKPIIIQPPKLSEALVVASKQIVENAKTLKVVTREDLTGPATDALSRVKKQAKALEDERVEMKKPSLDASRRVDALFGPAISELTEAANIIKKEMINAKQRFDKEDADKEAKILARSEKEGRGRLTEETAINKISEIPTIQKTNKTAYGSSTFKKVKEVTITDMTLIPIEYLRPANVADFKDFKPWPGIQKAAIAFYELIEAGHANIKQIPGVEVKLVDSLSAR